MDLRSTLIKMKESSKTEENFSILVETMKRKASKGLLEGIRPEEIDDVLSELDNKKEEVELPDLSDVSTELMEADKYFDKYLDSLTENELSRLLAEEYCSLINEGWIADAVGKIGSGIKTAAGWVKDKAVAAGTAIGSAFNPATGAALGPAIGAGAGLALGAAGIAAIVARLRRRKANVTESVEFIKYFNEDDIKYIIENCNIDENIVAQLLECDDENVALLTEEVINYSEDVLIENYFDTLDETLLEEIEATYPDTLTEKEEVFYHTRRYNRRQKKRYEEHPVRTAAIGVGSTAAVGTAGVLGTDAIVKDAQYKKDVGDRTAQGVSDWNASNEKYQSARTTASNTASSNWKTANDTYNSKVASETARGTESWNNATSEYNSAVQAARDAASKEWNETGKNEFTQQWLEQHGKSSVDDLTKEEYLEYMDNLRATGNQKVADAAGAVSKEDIFTKHGADINATDPTMAGQNAGKAVDKNAIFSDAGADINAETADKAGEAAANAVGRDQYFTGAGGAAESAEAAGAANAATAVKQQTLASKAWEGIKTGAGKVGEFVQNTPWVQGALVTATAIGGGVLIAKLIKKIREKHAAKKEAKAAAMTESFGFEYEDAEIFIEGITATKRAKLKKKYSPDNVDISSTGYTHPFNIDKQKTLASKSLDVSDNDEELAAIKSQIEEELDKDEPDKALVKKLYAEYKKLYKQKGIKKQAKDQLKAEKIEAKTGRNKLYEDYDLDKPIGELLLEDLYE